MSLISTLQDVTFRVYRIIGRTLIKYSGNPRPASHPFITGDGFRALAQHIFDDAKTCAPEAIRSGDIVFVGNSRIKQFFAEIHPQIHYPYVLITHNGDAPVDETVFALAQDKILMWYGINVTYDHPKIIPLPLGIENQHYYICGIPAVFKYVMRKNVTRLNKIFYGFTVATNPDERQPALEIISKHPQAETIQSWRGFYFYLLLLKNYKLVLSPPGSSVEGHRTWDTLYIGGVPIVKSSITTRYFKKIGVPLLLVDDWHELTKLTAVTIPPTYDSIIQSGVKETLTMDYWTHKIKHLQS